MFFFIPREIALDWSRRFKERVYLSDRHSLPHNDNSFLWTQLSKYNHNTKNAITVKALSGKHV